MIIPQIKQKVMRILEKDIIGVNEQHQLKVESDAIQLMQKDNLGENNQ